MLNIHDVLEYFLRAWMDVTADVYFHLDNNTLYIPPDNYQYCVVLLSIAFFYMICYSIHGLIEDWIRLFIHKRNMKKFRSRVARSKNPLHNDDSST